MLEWNGYPLKGRTFEEVYDIICESRADHDVEIIVSRPISDVGRPTSIGSSANMAPHGYLPQSTSIRTGGSKVRDRPAVTVTSPASPDTIHPSWGKVQVQCRLYIVPFVLVVHIAWLGSSRLVLSKNLMPFPVSGSVYISYPKSFKTTCCAISLLWVYQSLSKFIKVSRPSTDTFSI